MPWLRATSTVKEKDILEMDGRKAVPLRALIVEERVKSFKTRWYRVKETFTPLYVQHTRAFFIFRKKKMAHTFLWNDRRRERQ
ncbi:hypothetical protein GFB65_08375 [Enterococcus faecalis]|nr:hypothetical protein CUS73_14400 [Enterococcus faecalis]QPB60074.1 hypothetical protein GFB65_08375 [Enterococcus faecalis]